MPKRLETWQIWHAMRKTISDSFIMGVLGRRNARTIRMYAQDPRCTVDRSKDPIEALAILFDELATYGRADIAELGIKHLQQSIGCDKDLRCPDQLKPTVDAEILADFQVVADMKAAIEANKDPDEVRIAMTEAIHEIERTYTKYQQDFKAIGTGCRTA